jgi:hypothetical protein
MTLAFNPVVAATVLAIGGFAIAMSESNRINKEAKERVKEVDSAYSNFNKTLDSGKIDDVKNALQRLTETVDYDKAIKKIQDLKGEIASLQALADNSSALGGNLSFGMNDTKIAIRQAEIDRLQKETNKVNAARRNYEDLMNSPDNILKKRIKGETTNNDTPPKKPSDSGSSTSSTSLSDYLPREKTLLNYIENAQNKIKDLTNEETQARLDGIKPIEDANNELIKYYKTVRDTLADKEMIADINSKIIKLEGDNASLAKDRKDIEKDIADAKQKQVEEAAKLREEQQNTLKNLIKEQVETEQKIDKETLEDNLKIRQDIIDSIELENEELENQIDALEEKAELEDEIAKKKEFQLNLQKAQERLDNLKKEKNVRVLTQNGWEWQYDAIAVAEAEQEVTDIKTQYEDYRRELKLKHQRQELQDQINANKKEIEAEQDKMDDLKDAYDNKYKDIELIVETRLANMNITQTTKLDEMIVTATEKLDKLKELYADMAGLEINIPSSDSSDNNSSSYSRASSYSDLSSSQKAAVQEWIREQGGGADWAMAASALGYASGTDSSKSGLSLVGEKGAELRWLDQGTKILPSDLSKQLLNLPNLMNNFLNNMIQPQRLLQFSPAGVGGNSNNKNINITIDKLVTPNAKAFIRELNNRTALT